LEIQTETPKEGPYNTTLGISLLESMSFN
jgi:hypothetical protein